MVVNMCAESRPAPGDGEAEREQCEMAGAPAPQPESSTLDNPSPLKKAGWLAYERTQDKPPQHTGAAAVRDPPRR